MQTRRSRQRHIGAILVGGASTRFGSPKALADLGGRTLLERVLATFEAVLPTTFLVAVPGAGDEDPLSAAGSDSGDLSRLSAPKGSRPMAAGVVNDVLRGAGPLGGVHAALVTARARNATGACIAACDSPFIEASLLRTLLTVSEGHDAVIPVTGRPERIQPLFAWYSSDIVEQIEESVRRGRSALHHLIDDLPKVKLLPVEEIPLRRPLEIVFMNVNTPADLAEARRAIEEYPDES